MWKKDEVDHPMSLTMNRYDIGISCVLFFAFAILTVWVSRAIKSAKAITITSLIVFDSVLQIVYAMLNNDRLFSANKGADKS